MKKRVNTGSNLKASYKLPLSNEELTTLLNNVIKESGYDFMAEVAYCESYKNKESNSLYIKFIGPRTAEHLLHYHAVIYVAVKKLIQQYGDIFSMKLYLLHHFIIRTLPP